MKRALRYLRPVVAIVASLAALAACTQNGGAIFATIQQEEKTISTLLPKTIAVQNVLQLAVPAADGTDTPCFVAVAETPYVGVPETKGSFERFVWKSLGDTLPSAATAVRSAVALQVGATMTVYAVVASGDVTSLQKAVPDAGLAATSPTLSWTPVDPAHALVPADQSPAGLLLVNGELFLATRDTTVAIGYRLYHLDAGVTSATVAASTQTQVKGGAWDGAQYWFIAGPQLLTGTTDSLSTASGAAAPARASAAAYAGVLAVTVQDTLYLYLSTRGGELFMRSGTTWSPAVAVALTYPGDSAALAFTGLGIVGQTVYVGSDGRGFFDLTTKGLPTTGAALAEVRMPYRTISELYGGVVTRIVGLDGVVFVCTAGAGLWHKEIPGGTAFDPTAAWVWD